MSSSTKFLTKYKINIYISILEDADTLRSPVHGMAGVACTGCQSVCERGWYSSHLALTPGLPAARRSGDAQSLCNETGRSQEHPLELHNVYAVVKNIC